MNPNDDDLTDLSRFQVNSRKEIIRLLRKGHERNQFVRMQANISADAIVTSILDIDDENDAFIIDCASNAHTNERFLASTDISFEMLLENIRILFSAEQVQNCVHDNKPALRVAIPQNLIRLQRREFYRVMVPVTSSVKCSIQIPAEPGGIATTALVPVYNVSGGGVSVTDDKKQIPLNVSTIYQNCQIDIPGNPVILTLQLMNVQEVKLPNNKSVRRLGFRFIEPSNTVSTSIQRYITKLEREQNAKATGMS